MCDDRRVTAQPDAATAAPSALETAARLGESRWPPALALLAFMAINVALRVWLPNEGAIRAPWAVPAVEGVLLVLLLAGPATGTAHGKNLVDTVRAAHARHVRMIKQAHARHMRVVHRIEAAHERHMSRAPRPVREVHGFVAERHRAHLRFLGKTERFVEGRRAALERDVSGAVAVVDRHHREHQRTVGLTRAEGEVASIGASVEQEHRRHSNALERFADWLVGA